MKSQSVMTHRAAIERNTPGRDAAGDFTESWAVISDSAPCHAWTVNAQEVVASGRLETVKTRIVIMPKATDVRTGDRIQVITDRRGRTLFDGPLFVDGISEKADHWQLTTRKLT